MRVSVKLNLESIGRKASSAAAIKGLPIAQRRVFDAFKRAKDAMLREFDKHPVTLELRKGARAVPITDATDGYGNLFAFIGFDSGSKPTKPLRSLLDSSNIRQTASRKGVYYFRYGLPKTKEIEDASPMPWEEGNSWVTELENGTMSNLSHFLYKNFTKSEFSHSKWGIQTPWEIEERSFNKTPYLTEILENFRERVNNI